jgi:nitroimidazol reductase NimA-like FMN-containing flavoprotein (pyridoxamine 5'-phosphate oxidase superfamily)
MRRDLRPEDLGDLLERPLLAVLATRSGGDEVLLSPLWHEWRDGGFNLFTGDDDVKVRHIRRDPRVSIVVCEQSPPYRGIEIRARARLSSADIGDEAAGAWTDPGDVVIRIEPGLLRAWDFADDYP